MMQQSSHPEIHSYRKATSAYPDQTLRGTARLIQVLFAFRILTTETAVTGHIVRSQTSRSNSEKACSCVLECASYGLAHVGRAVPGKGLLSNRRVLPA